MNNRSHKAGRIIAALALAVASTVAAVSSSSAAGLPSVRLVSPTFDATNSVDATGDIAQYYSAGTKAFYTYIGHGTKLSLTYLVTTDGTTPAANQELRLQINAPWSGSKATWLTSDGKAVAAQNEGNFGLEVVGTTDAMGKVTFVVTNTDTTGLEDAPTSPIQDRGAIKPARLYGTMKVVLPGKGDKDADIDLVTFDITNAAPTEYVMPIAATAAVAQKISAVATSLKVGKSLSLPAKSTAGLAIKWASTTKSTCTVSGSKVTAKKKGSCSVTGTNAGDAKNSALSVTKKITIK
ncbi:MAG: hypothetical protein K9F92_02675 [Candidatus Nanopelagicaceae bacterium]|nr:hypothetical protein [Candidatus Nanopelagicaceae bacterium]